MNDPISTTPRRRLSNYAVAPGEYLAEMIDDELIEGHDLAQQLGWSADRMRALLAGTEPVTPAVAEGLELITDVPAKRWLALEAGFIHDLSRLGRTRAEHAGHAGRH